MFLYGKRYTEQFWDKPELFLKHKSACLAMPLNKFVVHFSVGTRGASRNKIRERTRKNTVVIFYPHVRSDPNAFTYPHYCKLELLKFKPWADGEDFCPFIGKNKPSNEDYCMLWKQFLAHCIEHGIPAPDHLQCNLDDYILNRDVVPHNQGDSI